MSNIILLAIDPGNNTGVSIFNLKDRSISQTFLTYNNSKEMFIYLPGEMEAIVDAYKPTHFVLEFTRFGKALVTTISHFGLIGLMYSLTQNKKIKWVNGLDKTKDSWGVNPTSVNAWCANQIGVPTKEYGDKESIAFATQELKRLKKAGWKISREEILCKNNEHVADSLGIGLYTLANVLKEPI